MHKKTIVVEKIVKVNKETFEFDIDELRIIYDILSYYFAHHMDFIVITPENGKVHYDFDIRELYRNICNVFEG